MANAKCFIVVQSESVANQLIACGFNLLSESCGTYTFVNEPSKSLNFANLDMTKIHFTDKLNI